MVRARDSVRARVLSSLLLRHPPPPPLVLALTDSTTDRFPSPPFSSPRNLPFGNPSFCSCFPCHLFLVTRRWKLRSPSRHVLRLLIRGTGPLSEPSRAASRESRVSAIRCNNFNTSVKFTRLKFEISFEIRSRLRVPPRGGNQRPRESIGANRSLRKEKKEKKKTQHLFHSKQFLQFAPLPDSEIDFFCAPSDRSSPLYFHFHLVARDGYWSLSIPIGTAK